MFEFDWDDANLEHIARHDVTREEAEQVCCSDPLYLDSYFVDDEERYAEIGQTVSGRILKVATTQRQNRLRVVTAYDASAFDKRMYLRSRLLQ